MSYQVNGPTRRGAGMTADRLPQIETLERDLNRLIVHGRFLDAFTKFYHPQAVMRPSAAIGNVVPDVDPAIAFFEWVETFVGGVPIRTAISDDVAYSEWLRGPASRDASSQAATRIVARRWLAGRVAEERIYDHPVTAGREKRR